MTIELNHTIVHAHDPEASASFVTGILGVADGHRSGPFIAVPVDNAVTLDFLADDGPFTAQHYAFLVTDDVFDAAHQRLTDQQVTIWADPDRHQPGAINHRFGGRGLYFLDLDGHILELLTSADTPTPAR